MQCAGAGLPDRKNLEKRGRRPVPHRVDRAFGPHVDRRSGNVKVQPSDNLSAAIQSRRCPRSASSAGRAVSAPLRMIGSSPVSALLHAVQIRPVLCSRAEVSGSSPLRPALSNPALTRPNVAKAMSTAISPDDIRADPAAGLGVVAELPRSSGRLLPRSRRDLSELALSELARGSGSVPHWAVLPWRSVPPAGWWPRAPRTVLRWYSVPLAG
jgi:hypothetical protein